MEKPMRRKLYVLNELTMFCYILALAWLFYKAFEGRAGTVVAVVLIGLYLIIKVFGAKALPKDVNATLLTNILVILLNLSALYDIRLLPFTALLGAGALFDIIFWCADGRYKGKSVREIMSVEFRISPMWEICMIIAGVHMATSMEMGGNVFVWIVIGIIALDLVRQKCIKP